MKWRFVHLTATTTVPGTESTLMTVNVNTAVPGSTVSIYNGSAAAANLLAVIDGGTIASKGYGVYVPNGINVVVAGGSPDVTIGYL